MAHQSQLLTAQIEVAEEQLETSRGILAKINDVISYINPFSENFFVYKLIDLLVDALKSLFVPDEDFFSDWIADMNSYFGARFGLIYYPIELVIDFLTRLWNASNNLNTNFTLTTPALTLFDTTLIQSTTYDFSTLLENETFANVYNVYLICVDTILILGLVILCKNTFADIFGGHYTDDVANDIQKYSVESNRSNYRTRKIGFNSELK